MFHGQFVDFQFQSVFHSDDPRVYLFISQKYLSGGILHINEFIVLPETVSALHHWSLTELYFEVSFDGWRPLPKYVFGQSIVKLHQRVRPRIDRETTSHFRIGLDQVPKNNMKPGRMSH